MNRKLKLLAKLSSLGCNTEKKIKDFDVRQLIECKDIKKDDILLFYNLKDAIKTNTFFTWLMGEDNV